MDRDKLARIEGPNLVLRLIETEDAGYVHGLRTDARYNRYLSEVRGTVEDQRRWIDNYKSREAAGSEFYYVIERKDGVRCGVVRLYDIDQDSFTWGSWILDENKPSKAALESALLSFGAAFETLCLNQGNIDVRLGNERAISFYNRMHMVEMRRTNLAIYYVYARERYEHDRSEFRRLIADVVHSREDT